jgi:hypothetical protein
MNGHQFDRIVKAQKANISACEQRGVVLSESEKTAIVLLVYKVYGKIFEMEASGGWSACGGNATVR